MSERPLILVTNDDGINAPGIRAVIEAVQPLGDVVVVAPNKPQSGMGHAITVHEPIFLKQSNSKFFTELGVEAWSCSGTPVDCVKLARDKILKRRPDVCVSGINHGSNASINVIYSGTMSAAMEGAIEGIPSVGFSLMDFSMTADFTAARFYARLIVQKMLEDSLPAGTLFNVNIPIGTIDDIKGVKLCRQADAKWVEEFDERTNPHGRKYYWLTGNFENNDTDPNSDVMALSEGWISLVPVRFDLTDSRMLARLQSSGFVKSLTLD